MNGPQASDHPASLAAATAAVAVHNENFFVHTFHAITRLFTTVKTKISEIFVSLFGKEASAKFAAGAEALLKTALGVIAQDAVAATASLALGNPAEARQAAFDKIAEDAKTQGIEASSSIYNMLIELAVQKVKGNIAVTDVTSPSATPPAAPAVPPVVPEPVQEVPSK